MVTILNRKTIKSLAFIKSCSNLGFLAHYLRAESEDVGRSRKLIQEGIRYHPDSKIIVYNSEYGDERISDYIVNRLRGESSPIGFNIWTGFLGKKATIKIKEAPVYISENEILPVCWEEVFENDKIRFLRTRSNLLVQSRKEPEVISIAPLKIHYVKNPWLV